MFEFSYKIKFNHSKKKKKKKNTQILSITHNIYIMDPTPNDLNK